MKKQYFIIDFISCSCFGIEKWDILKADSPGRTGSSHRSRPSIYQNTPSAKLPPKNNTATVNLKFVVEPVEFYIFKLWNVLKGYQSQLFWQFRTPQFFNST